MPFVDALPSNIMSAQQRFWREIGEVLLTIHDYFHIIHKSMDHTQSLCDGHLSLVLSQSIKPLEYGLNIALPQ